MGVSNGAVFWYNQCILIEEDAVLLHIDSWIRFVLTELFAVVLLFLVFRKPMLEGNLKKNVSLKILLIMLAMYLAQLFYVMLSPTYFFRRFTFSTERLNLIPFRVFSEWLAHPFNFFGNVLLFMPIGFFEVLLHPSYTRKQQLLRTIAVSAGISLFVEFAQLFNFRVSDVDDIILNTLGGVCGCLLCMLLQKLGFDKTRVGRFLLPRIPRSWRCHMHLTRFCVILVVTMEVVLFTVNYIVTIPKPKVRENTAAQLATEAPAEPESTIMPTQVPTEPAATTMSAIAPTYPPTEPESTPLSTPTPAVTATVFITPEPTSAPKVYNTDGLELEAQNILLVRLADDTRDEQAIYAVNSDDLIYPASTLKMVTALTVLDIADPDESVQVGTEIYIPPLDCSRASLEYGMTLTVKELLEGLLLPSGADAAYALGVYCGRKLEGNDSLPFKDAINAFVAAMNRKAAEIGAEHTTARNVVGLDDKEQRTTAEDILKIAKVFLDNPVLAEICGLPTAKITSEEGKTISLKNTNKMLLQNSEYYNGNVAGVKTGTTNRAGNCLVSVFTVQDERYLCIVMNSSYYGKFIDTQILYEVCAAAE